nr:HAD family hydrolase [Salsipaludibacter albus]
MLDRDGTLTVEGGYLDDPADLVAVPGGREAVAAAAAEGWRIAVVTNQSAVARGLVSRERLDELHAHLAELFPAVEAIYDCPHHPDDGCDCRKPRPGMPRAAMADLGLDPAHTTMVGDHLTDCEAARAAGAAGILVSSGHGARHAADAEAAGFPVVADLPAAIDRVLAG